MNNQKDYWKAFYSNKNFVDRNNLQRNVGRTRNGQTITEANWKKTIRYISKILGINKNTRLLELCSGNGLVIGNLAHLCQNAVAVDYSTELISQLKAAYGDTVKTIQEDVNLVTFPENSFDAIVIYFSIQHFNEQETILLTKKMLQWLAKGGKILIGDIPDELEKWNYINQPVHRKDYLTRAIENRPMIGYWYQKGFFLAFEDYFENIYVKILPQPDYQINSSYRFDVLIEKHG